MSAFLFGKLPAHGDFVCRGLHPGDRRWWDERLTLGIARACDEWDARFEELFDLAPPWRFRLDGVSGAVAASVDRAGRRFPLVVAVDGEGGAAHCEAALFGALTGWWDADRLLAELDGPRGGDDAPVARGWWLDGGEAAGVLPVLDPDPTALPPAMLAAAARLVAREAA